MEKNQKIDCNVYECKHCECDKEKCKLKEIKVCACKEDDHITMCSSYEKK